MAMSGDVTLNENVSKLMTETKQVYETSQQIVDDYKNKLTNTVNQMPLAEREEDLNSGVLVGTFDYPNGKPIPKLILVELMMKGFNPITRHSHLPGRGYDGSHYEKLSEYLRLNYNQYLTLKQGIALLKSCLNIVTKTSSDSVRFGKKDVVGGYMS
ncbi:hypothetical protein MKW98_002977, partial [Papaver atlanticum]